jgi:large subunit ribosomal protein L20
MPRVKRGVTTKARHKRLFARTKGMKAGRRNQVKLATQAVLKAGTNAYIDRRRKKRDFRGAWIISINAACRINGISYSAFIKKLSEAKIELNRKVLSEMAKNQPESFAELVKQVVK